VSSGGGWPGQGATFGEGRKHLKVCLNGKETTLPRHPSTELKTALPRHPSTELKTGLMEGIKKQRGLK
jgi:mRNA interferase HicA